MPFPPRPVADRFFEMVDWGTQRYEGTLCLEWTAATSKGYGRIAVEPTGRRVQAHRWLYERWFGPIPEGLVCDHLCRNRRCVNPAHIDLVTNKENVLRGVGITAVAARLTQCQRGHPFSSRGGHRLCLTCESDAQRRRRERRRQ